MKRRNLLIAAIAHFIVAVVLVVALFSLNGCFFIGQYPPEFSYPMEMEGDYNAGYDVYYVDVDYVPVYGVAVYYRLGPSYPYYYYHGGYGYYSYGRYYYRYYRVWTWGSVPYYWNNGSYVQIYETNYYSYDVTVNQWHSNPVPESYSYGAPANPSVSPKPGVGGPKHYEAYPPDSNKSHPVVQAIPKTDGSPTTFDHVAYPPSELGPNAPKPPQVSGLKIKALAPSMNPPVGAPKTSGISPKAMPYKPIQSKANTPTGKPVISGVSPGIMQKKTVQPVAGIPKTAPPPKTYTKPQMKPTTVSPYKPPPKNSTTYKSNIQKKSVKPYHPAKMAPHKSAPPKSFSPKIHPSAKVKH